MPAIAYPLISAVSDRRRLASTDDRACALLVEWAAAVAVAGVDIIQLREPGLTDSALAALSRRVVAATAGTRAMTLLNDRTDVALVTGSGGVHLPSTAPPAAVVRRVTPEGFVVGRSVHEQDDPRAAETGCDYLTFGTVFASASKPAGHRAAGLEALQCACRSATIPVQAIGGITLANAADVAQAGAAGVAAIGLFVDGWSSSVSLDRLTQVVGQLRAVFTRVGRPDSGVR
ncbi:MAG: thiamine phosphate synthase [Vicinamibacterales bacterium]